MANSAKSLKDAFRRGANGVEFDVRFDQDGKPLNIYHGYICDCFQKCDHWSNFVPYIQYIRNMTTPTHKLFNHNFTLAFIDLKADFDSEMMRVTAGQKLFEALSTHLFNLGNIKTRLKCVLSLLNIYDEYFIIGFMDSMKKAKMENINNYIAWDISNKETLGAIRFMYKRLFRIYNLNVWQSDGITNCINLLVPRDRVKYAVQIRDSQNPYMSKVCFWTIDFKLHIRESLRIGVDAILTNYPENAVQVLKEKEFNTKYRLANSDDNPWIKFNSKNE